MEAKEKLKYDNLRNQANKRNLETLNYNQDQAQKEANRIVINILLYNSLDTSL